ncbi:MAG: hypothetical protein HYS27_17840 [Deltaproteobacteria bacterium]|nr:hypothetical protein [Deltaproteobacteria bacterium]
MNRTVSSLIALVLAAVAAACVSLEPPARFLVTDRSGDQLKAITPEESKLWVRRFDDEDKGGLDFWKDALKSDLKDNRGYLLVAEAPATDGTGAAGHTMTLETTVNGRPVRELLAVFVRPGLCGDSIWVLEYVAPKDVFDKELASVTASLSTLR